MTHPADIKRKWFLLAKRHLDMAYLLHDQSWLDGAIFHGYHACECTLNAIIVYHGYKVPPEGRKRRIRLGKPQFYYVGPLYEFDARSTHEARFKLCSQMIDSSRSYHQDYIDLAHIVGGAFRNDSLYYSPMTDLMPHELLTTSRTMDIVLMVAEFMSKVWADIY